MNTTKIAISLPQHVLTMIDTLAKSKQESRSRFIAKSLEKVSQILLQQEVANSYDEVFADKQVQSEQLEWSEGLLAHADTIINS